MRAVRRRNRTAPGGRTRCCAAPSWASTIASTFTADLRLPEGREIFLKLGQRADIVIENVKPGTLAGWGVGYADVAAVKADIIYVSIGGFGQYGPLSERPAYDPIAQNFCDWSSLNGDPQGGPSKAPTFLGDQLAGLYGALGALAALAHRGRTGEGQHVDGALIDGLMFQGNGNLTSGAVGIPLQRYGNQFAIAAPVSVYECSDGRIYGGARLLHQEVNDVGIVVAGFVTESDNASAL